jgi:hypothetical protein
LVLATKLQPFNPLFRYAIVSFTTHYDNDPKAALAALDYFMWADPYSKDGHYIQSYYLWRLKKENEHAQ